jgi:cytidine deaminase
VTGSRERQPEVDWEALRAAARSMIAYAYVPYSRYPVGAAALVDDGRVVTGCNVENASYGVTLCAECGLVSSLAASGGGRLVAFACVDGHGAALMPCGRCRQLLWEHGGPELMVDTPEGIRPMTAVLPQAFGPDHLLSSQGGDPLEPPTGVTTSEPLTRPNDYGA